jgi:uncharacterized protein (DUF362 family)/NAD-dependent dihydropyrimidine dehydrogenase PreA subunit
MSKIVIIRCGSYAPDEVTAAVKKGIGLLGGAGAFAKTGEKILLKPNWLMAQPPEKCVTTHPAVFRAVAEAFQSMGAKLSYGDSPAAQSPEATSRKTGFTAVATELNIPLADFRAGKEIIYHEARQNKVFTIANGVLESDGVVSLPKLKTHGFMKLTGCIKNQFGCIPGALKGEFHVKLQDPADFARMLVDLNAFVKPRLYIMDGIMGMEGNGPMGGDPVKMNVLLFSADPVALDATVCRMIGVDPALSLTITCGAEAGCGVFGESEIELLGDPLESFMKSDFKVNREPIVSSTGRKGFAKLFSGIIVPRPVIVEAKCVRCGVCVKMCPVSPKVVDWHDDDKTKPPSYDYDRCIRCYCCQECCPEGAIVIKKPLLRKIISRKKK